MAGDRVLGSASRKKLNTEDTEAHRRALNKKAILLIGSKAFR